MVRLTVYHPTPYYWTTAEGVTHVLYNNHMPPGTGFGWGSLCGVVQLPIEGRHFELKQNATEEDITCQQCRKRISGPHVEVDHESVAEVNGCLVRFGRTDGGVIVRAEKVCQGMLHHSLAFDPESFSGDLTEEVEEVCSECWNTYVDHQWSSRDEGAELCVEVRTNDNRSEYFSESAETVPSGNETHCDWRAKMGSRRIFLARRSSRLHSLLPGTSSTEPVRSLPIVGSDA